MSSVTAMPTADDSLSAWGLHGSITADQARALAKKRAGEVADSRDPAEERRNRARRE